MVHLLWHTASVAFMCMGLYATIEWHHLKSKAELYSLHSWLGVKITLHRLPQMRRALTWFASRCSQIATVTMYGAQYLAGFWHFFFPGSRAETRRSYHPMHVVMDIFTYFTANFTIVTGIAEKNYEQECWYKMNWYTRDYNPAAHFSKIPLGCRYSNGVGFLVFCTIFCSTYAAMDMRATIVRKTARRSSFLDLE